MECNENGISIITCSMKPELCSRMLESVKKTIGINFETVIFDNREKGYGICQVIITAPKMQNFHFFALSMKT